MAVLPLRSSWLRRAASFTYVRHCLNRMQLCRLLTKGCAAVWRHKAFVLSYRWLINKRKEMRDAVPKPALDPDVLASVGPRVAEAFQVSYKLIDQIDIVLLNQYLRTAEDNTPAALAGLKFLVQLHEAEHREKAPVQAEIDAAYAAGGDASGCVSRCSREKRGRRPGSSVRRS